MGADMFPGFYILASSLISSSLWIPGEERNQSSKNIIGAKFSVLDYLPLLIAILLLTQDGPAGAYLFGRNGILR
jgi:hypothetical protein